MDTFFWFVNMFLVIGRRMRKKKEIRIIIFGQETKSTGGKRMKNYWIRFKGIDYNEQQRKFKPISWPLSVEKSTEKRYRQLERSAHRVLTH